MISPPHRLDIYILQDKRTYVSIFLIKKLTARSAWSYPSPH